MNTWDKYELDKFAVEFFNTKLQASKQEFLKSFESSREELRIKLNESANNFVSASKGMNC